MATFRRGTDVAMYDGLGRYDVQFTIRVRASDKHSSARTRLWRVRNLPTLVETVMRMKYMYVTKDISS